jgi:predicted amidophosphoribosyltransferase
VSNLTVEEASGAYLRAMRNVPPVAPGICEICKTFIDESFTTCYACLSQPNRLDVVVPITYSEHLGQMHTALRYYKDGVPDVQRYVMPRLAAILWRFLEEHEPCVARAAGVRRFTVVTTVPSSAPDRDEMRKNLRTIVGWCDPIKNRYRRVLRATGDAPPGRAYDERRYVASERADDESVLLIDDTWTTGGHAQSAAHALGRAGASDVALVVIGRHLNPEWEVAGKTSADLFEELPKPFDWATCAVHQA